jgi:hypothetical protein
MARFTARKVAITEMADLNTFLVALAEQPDGSGAQMQFQRAPSFDAQDVALGWTLTVWSWAMRRTTAA